MFHLAQFVTAAHRFIVLVKLFIHMECYRETECFMLCIHMPYLHGKMSYFSIINTRGERM